ncbi:ornithine cyclodeaminase family protein [Dictyobacter arantiisoli]|uniref:Ornithine cyclodeaminase n=1 Tax=Dictyobacter arantiisoli TaxID=2014874 RepID=A0A5A5TAT0_9CHLR|nr:ornithine cyclodeaminase family protein [Dictyobacter arantiisoli]GCF08355.1 ornithine cyclodeaminase [Dictyobacter arantiisoli]
MQSQNEQGILYLSQKDVEQICQELDSVEIIREAFILHGSGQTVLPDEAYLTWRNGHGEQVRSLGLPAYVGGAINKAGIKVINGNIHNPSRGLPRASGLTLLFDENSVRILSVMEGAYLSSLRTASVSLLAVEILQGSPICSVAVIGAGVLAMAHIELLLKRLPALQVIHIFDLSQQRIQVLHDQIQEQLQQRKVVFHAVESAEEAIKEAQLIITATTTTEGYIRYSWLQAGAILVNISLDDPLPEVVFQADSVIVDDWGLVKSDTRRLIGRMYRQGQVVGPNEKVEGSTQRQIDAEMSDIVTGKKKGRNSNHDIILVNPFGLAIEDVALSARVYQHALQHNIGIWLER